MKFELNKVKLLRGQDEQFLLFLLTSDLQYFQIHGATALVMRIVKADGQVLEKAPNTGMSTGFGDTLWLYQFTLTSEEIDLLPAKKDQDVVLKIEFGSYCKYLTLEKCVSVNQRGF